MTEQLHEKENVIICACIKICVSKKPPERLQTRLSAYFWPHGLAVLLNYIHTVAVGGNTASMTSRHHHSQPSNVAV